MFWAFYGSGSGHINKRDTEQRSLVISIAQQSAELMKCAWTHYVPYTQSSSSSSSLTFECLQRVRMCVWRNVMVRLNVEWVNCVLIAVCLCVLTWRMSISHTRKLVLYRVTNSFRLFKVNILQMRKRRLAAVPMRNTVSDKRAFAVNRNRS